MSVTRLQVVYKSPEVDVELDKKIIEFFNKLDFTCIDRVYHSIIFRREIFFETQGEIEANKEMRAMKEQHKNESTRSEKVKLEA